MLTLFLVDSISPISMVAISDEMLEFFEENSMGWGSTFQVSTTAMSKEQSNELTRTSVLETRSTTATRFARR